MFKYCLEYGCLKVFIVDDVEYYWCICNYNKFFEILYCFNIKIYYGCFYDCGLCFDYEQYFCFMVVEIIDCCNLSCFICYVGFLFIYGCYCMLEEVKVMLDVVVVNEVEFDVVQISGGEFMLYLQFFEILDYVKLFFICYFMVNINGIFIVKDVVFVE